MPWGSVSGSGPPMPKSNEVGGESHDIPQGKPSSSPFPCRETIGTGAGTKGVRGRGSRRAISAGSSVKMPMYRDEPDPLFCRRDRERRAVGASQESQIDSIPVVWKPFLLSEYLKKDFGDSECRLSDRASDRNSKFQCSGHKKSRSDPMRPSGRLGSHVKESLQYSYMTGTLCKSLRNS
jgi:hypothetical protein